MEQPVPVDPVQILTDRVSAAVTSSVPRGTSELLERFPGSLGLTGVGGAALKEVRRIKLSTPAAPTTFDPQAYLSHTASVDQPFSIEAAEGLFAAPGLTDWCDGLDRDVDILLSPTGLIRQGEDDVLRVVIDRCEGLASRGLIANLPLMADWFNGPARTRLLDVLRGTNVPVALTILTQFDPFESLDVLTGVLEVVETAEKVIIHRTDMSAIYLVGRGAVGASIGLTTSLRHTVPPLRRSRTRRRKGPGERGVAVFLPGINEFRDVRELERWFGDRAPVCGLNGCCERSLTDFTDDPDDLDVLALHNALGWATVVSELLSCPAPARGGWLTAYADEVRAAYAELRATTGVRDIHPYGGAKNWLRIT